MVMPANTIIDKLSQVNLPDEELKNCLNQVESTIYGMAIPVLERFDEQRRTLADRVVALNSTSREESNKVDDLESKLKSLKTLADANELILKTERAEHEALKKENDEITKEIEKTKKFIADNRSLWETHKWEIVVGSIVVVSAVFVGGAWVCGAFAKKKLAGIAASKGAGLVKGYTFARAPVPLVQAQVVTRIGLATPALLQAGRLVAGQIPQPNREPLPGSAEPSATQLKNELSNTQTRVQSVLEQYYPIPQGTLLHFKQSRRKDFIINLNSACQEHAPSTVMAALYKTSFEDPVDRIVSRLYTEMAAGNFETSTQRLEAEIRWLENYASRKILNIGKNTTLADRGKLFLISALKIKLLLDKIKQAQSQVESLFQTSSIATTTAQTISVSQVRAKAKRELLVDQQRDFKANKDELARLKMVNQKLREDIKAERSRLEELNKEATRIRTAIKNS